MSSLVRVRFVPQILVFVTRSGSTSNQQNGSYRLEKITVSVRTCNFPLPMNQNSY